MKLLFCHYGPMPVDKQGNAYSSIFSDEVLERYYSIADDIVFFTRTELIDSSKAKGPKINNEKFRIARCPNLSSIKGRFKDSKNAKKVLKTEIKKSDFLIVRLPSQIGDLAIKMVINVGKPYLIELVGCPWDAYWNHSVKGKLIAPIMYIKTKKNIKDASHVVYVTNDYLQKRYPTNGESVNCSNVSIKNLNEKIIANRLKKIGEISSAKKLIIGTTGAINIKYKGQEYVIKALGRLKEHGITKFEYQLVGGGDLSYLKNIAKRYNVLEQVKFLGEKPHNEVIEWLDTIDLYIQPSLTEGLPRALIEALSRGLPSIGSNAGGIPELLDEKVIFEKKSISELFNLLSTIDSNFMREQAIRNFNEAKKYDKQIIERRRLEFFNKFKNEMLER